MFPVICKIGPFTAYSYGLLLVLAFCIATFLLSRQAKAQGINQELIFNLSFVILVSGIIGARILYVILNLKFYLSNPVEIIMLSHGGLAWFGAFILGSLCCAVYLKNKGLDFYKTFDLIIPYVALAQGIGRVGCFLNGCCFGTPSSLGWAIVFPEQCVAGSSPIGDQALHPTQIYSSIFGLALFFFLNNRLYKPHRRGEIISLYLIFSGAFRFGIDFIRHYENSANFIINQVVALGLVIFGIIILIRAYRKKG